MGKIFRSCFVDRTSRQRAALRGHGVKYSACAWQRGAENSSLLDGVNPSKKRSLNIPESMDKIETIVARKSNHVFIKAVMTTWYDQAEDKKECKQAAKATDLAFNMLRSSGGTIWR
jgi:hypothetical protein